MIKRAITPPATREDYLAKTIVRPCLQSYYLRGDELDEEGDYTIIARLLVGVDTYIDCSQLYLEAPEGTSFNLSILIRHEDETETTHGDKIVVPGHNALICAEDDALFLSARDRITIRIGETETGITAVWLSLMLRLSGGY